MAGGLDGYLRHPRHGPLPALLIVLTVATGLVDAVSILGLGRVFVANMTGNVVFIGFGLAGAEGYSISGSLVALVGFLVGASAGGVLVHRIPEHRGRLLRDATAVELVLLVGALLVAVAGPPRPGLLGQLVIVALAAVGLGVQNAVVRRLAVPDLTTTVLTMTLTGIGSDLRRRDLPTLVRRLIAVAAMLVGAAVGAVLVLNAGLGWGLAAVVAVLAVVLVVAALGSRMPADWHRGS